MFKKNFGKTKTKSHPKINLYYNGETNMKSKTKFKIIILITLGIIFALALIINFTPGLFTDNNNVIDSDDETPKISAVSGKICIINNSGWVDFRNAGNCTGSGTYSDPYVIEDLEIDGGGGFGSPIWIENSNVYFKIENCTVYNTVGIWNDAGIRLSNVTHSQLINNTCSSNSNGILLYECFNNMISGTQQGTTIILGYIFSLVIISPFWETPQATTIMRG